MSNDRLQIAMKNAKACKTCNTTKNITEFYKNPNVKDGYLNKCKDCVRQYDIQRTKKHPGPRTTGFKTCSFCQQKKRVSEYSKRLRAKDGLRHRCKPCDRKEDKKYRQNNPSKQRLCKVKHTYGLNKKEYEALVKKHNGKCAICEFDNKQLGIDHCHYTGKVRGLLCSRCNSGIGMLGDDVKTLQKAMKYLKENS